MLVTGHGHDGLYAVVEKNEIRVSLIKCRPGQYVKLIGYRPGEEDPECWSWDLPHDLDDSPEDREFLRRVWSEIHPSRRITVNA